MTTTPATDTPPAPSALSRGAPETTTSIAATAVLALTAVIAGLVTGGPPNVVAASFALLPLIATAGYLRSARWAPAAAVVTVFLLLMLRLEAVAFDLVRPGDLVPFSVAVVTVLSAGVALASALLVWLKRHRDQPVAQRFAIDAAAGVVLGIPTDRAPVPLPDAPRPVEELDPSTAVITRQVVFNATPGGAFTIDGRTFDIDRIDARAALDTMEIWEIVNDHSSDHPFHLHSYFVQVLDRATASLSSSAPGATPSTCPPARPFTCSFRSAMAAA